MTEKARYNDVGTAIEVTIQDVAGTVFDISGASTKTLYLRSPSGVVTTHTATFSTDGTDGKVQYVTVTGDIDEIGEWRAQVYLVTATGSWRTSQDKFEVEPILIVTA